ncbi:MAG: small-conductance mechanosensitive channel [Saprospiraceae bacterium]|jgi:small-conductance mechanosensitive channel
MIKNWLESAVFTVGDHAFLGRHIFLFVFIVLFVLLGYRFTNRWLASYSEKHKLPKNIYAPINRLLIINWCLALVILLSVALSLDPILESIGEFQLTFSNLLSILMVILVAKMADSFISARIVEEISSRSEEDVYKNGMSSTEKRSAITRVIQFSLLTIALIIIFPLLEINVTIQTVTINDKAIDIRVTNVLSAVLVILFARILVWLSVNILLYGWYHSQRIDHGKQYAYNQLLSYIVYTIAFIIALQYVGFNLTLLWAGAAALLVGIGFALQQTISDFFSGLVILFERSLEAGDFLDFGDMQGTVKKIGLRASIVETLERKDLIIPNSKLVNENVINWTKTKPTTRFEVLVGVAYGSDLVLVKQTLLQSAMDVRGVLLSPKPFVRFLNFGDSSLDFGLFFFSMNVTNIEDIKSDLRFKIDQFFRENGVEIPFPQRVIWQGKDSGEH